MHEPAEGVVATRRREKQQNGCCESKQESSSHLLLRTRVLDAVWASRGVDIALGTDERSYSCKRAPCQPAINDVRSGLGYLAAFLLGKHAPGVLPDGRRLVVFVVDEAFAVARVAALVVSALGADAPRPRASSTRRARLRQWRSRRAGLRRLRRRLRGCGHGHFGLDAIVDQDVLDLVQPRLGEGRRSERQRRAERLGHVGGESILHIFAEHALGVVLLVWPRHVLGEEALVLLDCFRFARNLQALDVAFVRLAQLVDFLARRGVVAGKAVAEVRKAVQVDQVVRGVRP